MFKVARGCRVRTKSLQIYPVTDQRFSFLFMSATDEELENVHDIEMDHVTYVLIMLRYVDFTPTILLSSLKLRRLF